MVGRIKFPNVVFKIKHHLGGVLLKRILSIVLFLIISLGTVQAYASEVSQDEKQTIPVLIVNNAYVASPSNSKLKSEMAHIFINQITKTLASKYNVREIDNNFNIRDVASTEKNDILDMFKGANYPAVMLIEILPIHSGMYTDFCSIHVKILDVNAQKYLYNGKIWRVKSSFKSAFGDMGTELDEALKDAFKL